MVHSMPAPGGAAQGGWLQGEQPSEIGGVVAQQVIEHELTAKAPPATVFALLADGSTWPSWSPLGSFELVHAGDGDPEGVGAVRIFRTGRVQTRERVVMAKPNERFSYQLISGLAVRDYLATVRLQSRAREPSSPGARRSAPRCRGPAGSTGAS
jgi:uncharacterized protein YndB with AHSA1/START domain